jgi:hypothetical protein
MKAEELFSKPTLIFFRKLVAFKMQFFVLLVMTLLWLIFGFYRPFEPHYHGKCLSRWADDYCVNEYYASPEIKLRNRKCEEAIQHIGVKGLPLALELCRAKDSKVKEKMVGWSEDLSEKLHFDIHICSAVEKQQEALAIFYVLGASAKPAIPSLIEVLQGNYPLNWDTAMEGLHIIGPDSIPPLIELLTNESEKLTNKGKQGRYNATRCLGWYFRRQASNAVPILLQFLEDKDVWLRCAAAKSLTGISRDSTKVVPALVKYIETETNTAALSQVVPDFGYLGTNGRLAIPILTKFAESNQYRALVALYKIDPATAELIFEKWRASQTNVIIYGKTNLDSLLSQTNAPANGVGHQ